MSEMFDKRKNFKEEVEAKLKELKQACHYNGIPFMFIAITSDDGEETEYVADGITPGSMNLTMKDDRIKKAINALNGLDSEVMYKTTADDFDFGDEGLSADEDPDEV